MTTIQKKFDLIARNLISSLIPPIKTSDTGQRALQWMYDFHVRHLPVIADGRLMGIISEDEILDFNRPDAPVAQFTPNLSRVAVKEHDHIYDVIRLMINRQLTTIPVIDAGQRFVGLITLENIIQSFGEALSLHEPGAIVVLEIAKRNYMLSEIARIAESENIIILSSFISSHPTSNTLEITLKLNTQNIRRAIATYERFDYIIKAFFHESDYLDNLKERYDALMNYLNV